MLDQKRLEDYLRLVAHYGDSSLLPNGATNVRVLNVRKLSGGMTNDVYSFSLRFEEKDSEKAFNLVLKGYAKNVGLWSGIYHQGEEVRQYIKEFETQKTLALSGFPVPRVYLCESDSFFLGYPFLIMQQEQVVQDGVSKLNSFAAILAALHNLDVDNLGLRCVRFPEDGSEFARDRLIRLKHYVNGTRHYRFLKKDFDYAISWLESNASDNNCPKYCLLHGEYHPGHALLTDDNKLVVIDWESVTIGDPAFDVSYAYHLVKLMNNDKNSETGEEIAETFLSEYAKNFHGDVHQRLEFYKIVTLLGVAVAVSSWISDPIEVYRRFGNKALARAIAFPFFRSNFLARKWLNSDFLMSYLQYCHEFIEETLRR